MNNIFWNKNTIEINNKKTTLEYDILEIAEIQNMVLVVTTPINSVNNNLYGISVLTNDIWQIQDYTEINPKFSQTPYVGITISQNKAIATDFCGCRFIVNALNGKIEGREGSVK